MDREDNTRSNLRTSVEGILKLGAYISLIPPCAYDLLTAFVFV